MLINTVLMKRCQSHFALSHEDFKSNTTDNASVQCASLFGRYKCNELSEKIDMYVESHGEDDHNAGIVLDILDILEPKMEVENTLILIITDY